MLVSLCYIADFFWDRKIESMGDEIYENLKLLLEKKTNLGTFTFLYYEKFIYLWFEIFSDDKYIVLPSIFVNHEKFMILHS